MTELPQLQAALLQTLENLQRSGLGRIPRLRSDSLPAEFHQWLASQRAASVSPARSSDSASLANPVGVSPNRTAPSTAQRTTSEPNALAENSALAEHRAGAEHIGPTENNAPARPRAALRAASVSQPSPAAGDRVPWGMPLLEPAARQIQLDQIKTEVQACRRCADIVCFRRQTVFGTGPLQPTVVFMGEAPGADEDQQGVPFVGRAGQLLTKIIQAMQLKREEVFILNSLKCRPPQNRTPSPEEIEACRPFVISQLDVLQPKYIVCLGAVAVRSLLGLTQSVGGLRGRFHQYRQAQVVVTYHPSYLLRNESAKKLVWQDMQMLMRELGLK